VPPLKAGLSLVHVHSLNTSDVKSGDSALSQDSLETHFGCIGLGLGLDVVVLSIVQSYAMTA